MLYRFIIFIAICYFTLFVWQQRDRFSRTYDYNYFGALYTDSQYVRDSKYFTFERYQKTDLGDDGLYAFAGGYYIRGGDISQVNFENPPLGKYLIGLSTIVFHNELFINIFYAVILFILVYTLSLRLTKDKLISSVSLLLFITQPVVSNQVTISMLDLPMIVFFIAGLYAYLKATQDKKPKKDLFLSALLFSLSFVIRFFPILPVILLILIIGLVNKGKAYWFSFTIFLAILVPLVYLVSHAIYFYYHPSFFGFLRYQKWILWWRGDNPFKIGNIIFTLLIGRYRSWWQDGGWLVSSDWNLLTSLISSIGLLSLWRWRRFPRSILAIMTVFFFVYIAVATVGVGKFILPILPLLVISTSETIVYSLRGILAKHG